MGISNDPGASKHKPGSQKNKLHICKFYLKNKIKKGHTGITKKKTYYCEEINVP